MSCIKSQFVLIQWHLWRSYQPKLRLVRATADGTCIPTESSKFKLENQCIALKFEICAPEGLGHLVYIPPVIWALFGNCRIKARAIKARVARSERVLFVPLYVMQSWGINWNLNMWHFQFCIWLKSSLREVHFAENPTWIESKVIAIERFSKWWKTKEIHSFFRLYLTINAADWFR